MRPIGRTLVISLSVVPLGVSLLFATPASAQPDPQVEPTNEVTASVPAPARALAESDPDSPAPTETPVDTGDLEQDEADDNLVPQPAASSDAEAQVHGERAVATQSDVSPNWGRFAELGGAARLGTPVADEEVRSDGIRILRFPNAALITGPKTGTRLVEGAILERYLLIGGPDSSLGLPITDEVPGGRGSRAVLFEHGRIYTAAGVGTYELQGAILNRFLALNGEHGLLGLPTSAEVAGHNGSRIQTFQGGRVYWTAPFGAHEVYGAILVKYDRIGGEASPLGPPKSGEVAGPAGTRMSYFQHGHIYHGSTGTHEVFGAILMRYLAEGGPAGQLGLPTSGEEGWDYGRISRFQYGTITWNAFNGDVRTNYAINPRMLIHPRTGVPFNANVSRWAPTVVKALTDNGLSTNYTPGVLAQIQQESGGNPNAVNTWDINWQNGYASFGLLQTIAPTYQSFAPPGQRGTVTWINVNGRSQRYVPEMVMPYNNIYAGINYAKTRYGLSRLNAWNSGYNYAYGEDSVPEARLSTPE